MRTNSWLTTDMVVMGLWLVSLVAAFGFGRSYNERGHQAAQVPVLQKAITHHNAKAAAGHAAEKKSVEKKARIETHFQKLNNEVIRYVQANPTAPDCGLDADGLRIWQAANRGAEADTAGQPDAGLWQFAPASEWEAAGPAGEPRGVGEVVPPLRGTPARPGRLDRGGL